MLLGCRKLNAFRLSLRVVKKEFRSLLDFISISRHVEGILNNFILVDLKYLSFAYLQDKLQYRVLQVQNGKIILLIFSFTLFFTFFSCTHHPAIVNNLGS